MPCALLSGEGRLSAPLPVPGPGGASLWPPLLAAGGLVDGDAVVERLLTEQFYALAPILLGDRLQAHGVRFTQEPLTMGPMTTAVFDDTCGNLIQIASRAP